MHVIVRRSINLVGFMSILICSLFVGLGGQALLWVLEFDPTTITTLVSITVSILTVAMIAYGGMPCVVCLAGVNLFLFSWVVELMGRDTLAMQAYLLSALVWSMAPALAWIKWRRSS